MTRENLEKEKKEKLSLNEKELLYCLFYEITSEIKNIQIEVKEEEYKKNIRNINSNQLIQYLHDSIKILLKKKFEEGKEEGKKKVKLKKYDKNEIEQLENYIKKLEEKERNLTKLIFKYKSEKEILNNNISDLLLIENEYKEMKEKLKYEDGKFLDNDRKDNEIIILRKENVNLKKYISENEKKLKKYKIDINEKEKIIVSLETKIQKFKLKLEKEQKEINFEGNNNTNISTNILSINKQDSTNNENNYSHSPNLKLFQMQRIRNKLFKKKHNLKQIDNSDKKIFFIQKFLSSAQNRNNNNSSLNNSSSIKIGNLSIKNIKISNKGIPFIKNHSEVNVNNNTNNINNIINIYQSGFYSSRKSNCKYQF